MNQFFKATALAIMFVAWGAWAQTAKSTGALDCKAPSTQKQMNDCAYEDFLTANAGYAEGNKSVSTKLSGKQRDLFRRSQKAWIAFSAAACDFESSAVEGGSGQGMVKWQCMARMTRARVAEMSKMGNCPEGDLTCLRFKK